MDPPLFFIHVVKTGGTTFRRHLELQLGVERLYPNDAEDEDLFTAKNSVQRLRGLSEERWDRVRALTLHMPFFASTVLGRSFVTATILRDPVGRTVSHLKNWQRTTPRCREWSLEKIYDDPWAFELTIHNHQVRLFALRASDGANTHHQPIDIDDDRLKQALDNIARVDILGLHDRYDEFVDAVHRRFGWERRSVPRMRVSPPADVPESLVRRIKQDNAADIEFYQRVKDLYRSAGD